MLDTGMKFGKLTVIKFDHLGTQGRYYLCRCDCGNEAVVRGSLLTNGNTKSCGCFLKESLTKHGMCKTRFYKIWQGMKYRCLNPNSADYENYGGRGISVCQEWQLSFDNFYDDMYESYQDHVKVYGEKETTLDRIDVNKDYSKDNCRWQTLKEQCNNQRRTIWVRSNKNEKWQSLKLWCKEHNENYCTWQSRRRNKSKLFTLEEKVS